MVTSAAVPAVVGTAIIGTQGFLVGATPSRLRTCFKFRVGDDDADGLGGIHRGTAADCDDVVSAGSLERYNAVLYVFDGRVCFDIGVDFISKTSRSKISVTFAVTPNLIRSGSEHTNAFRKA